MLGTVQLNFVVPSILPFLKILVSHLKQYSNEFERARFQSLTCAFMSVKIAQTIILLDNAHQIVKIWN